ncbi:MAG: hypothetical protein WCR30_01785 [Clostridia bacterium]
MENLVIIYEKYKNKQYSVEELLHSFSSLLIPDGKYNLFRKYENYLEEICFLVNSSDQYDKTIKLLKEMSVSVFNLKLI